MDPISIQLSWPAAVTIITVLGTIVGLLFTFLPKKNKKDDENDLEKRIQTLEINYPNLNNNMEELKKSISHHEDQVEDDINKLDNKIQKLMDLLIDLVSGKK